MSPRVTTSIVSNKIQSISTVHIAQVVVFYITLTKVSLKQTPFSLRLQLEILIAVTAESEHINKLSNSASGNDYQLNMHQEVIAQNQKKKNRQTSLPIFAYSSFEIRSI